MNLIAYFIYLLITYAITVHVGRSFYRNGRIYILGMLNNDEALTNQINKVLLTGYYLMNIGYATLMLAGWEQIVSIRQMVEDLSINIGQIVLLIACMHYLNMTIILLWNKINKYLTAKKVVL